MISFKQYSRMLVLNESTIGLGDPREHLTHIEDLIIEHGLKGVQMLKDQINGILDFADALEDGDDPTSKLEVNLKVDGAPALYFGYDPREEWNNEFFVGTKHDLTNLGQSLSHSPEEIKENHLGKDGLIAKLIEAYDALKPLYDKIAGSIDYRIIQTDMLFGNPGEKRFEALDGIKHITFHPQLIKYAIPVDKESKLYNIADKAIFGIGVHDTWFPALETVNGRERIMLRNSNKSYIGKVFAAGEKHNVLVINSNFPKDSTNIALDDNKKIEIQQLLNSIEKELGKVDEGVDAALYPQDEKRHSFIDEVTVFINNEVRKAVAEERPTSFYSMAFNGIDYDDAYLKSAFHEFIDTKAEGKRWSKKPNPALGFPGKLKGEKGLETAKSWGLSSKKYFKVFKPYFKSMYHTIKMKVLLLEIFDEINSSLKIGSSFYEQGDGSFVVDATGSLGYGRGEGFALFVGDNHVKLVDRLVFSARNLTNPKFGRG